MSSLCLAVATMHRPPFTMALDKAVRLDHQMIGPGDSPLALAQSRSWPTTYVKYNTPEENTGVVGSYELLYQASTEDILAFIHDDLIIRERNWDERVLREFEDPCVGIVGFGGALSHGTPDLYKVPYVLHNLRRGSYLSNVDDAEVHGERFDGSCDVAVLDGFSLIVRRSMLERIGGFATFGTGFFCYDYELCARARRYGYRVRCVGVRCHHRGGGTSVQAKSEITSQEEYDRSHRWFYDNFKDVMPHDVTRTRGQVRLG